MMAPTKKPSSRWKIVPHAGQKGRTRKGDWKTERAPHAGQLSCKPRASVPKTGRPSLVVNVKLASHQQVVSSYIDRNLTEASPFV